MNRNQFKDKIACQQSCAGWQRSDRRRNMLNRAKNVHNFRHGYNFEPIPVREG